MNPVPGQALVEILAVASAGEEETRSRLRIVEGSKPSAPLAPASLYLTERWQEVLQLHRLDDESDDILEYTTYGDVGQPPSVGDRVILQCWFTPEQLALVRNTSLQWRREPVPDALGDEHCALTWERIAPGVESCVSERGDRITVAAFDTLIEGDLLRVRATG